ncbi:MAG: J domain-containing protein [Proteobacteria bacterium]|nr:J domain-containing protein [Pseudomonadota bacterium]MCP4915461.1 J domain-containing protein [Pseudomonadota bacterium]
MADLYQTLGVARDAPMQDIKKAYRKLARELHPDVAGEDPVTVERFKAISEAYEVLSDPVQRGRYDRRFQKRTPGRMAGGFNWWSGDPPEGPNSRGMNRDPANDIGLDDIFADADFGFGGKRPRSTSVSKDRRPAPKTPKGRPTAAPPPPPPRVDSQPGTDISMAVDVPRAVAARGGTVTLTYMRLVHTDDRRSVVEYDEIHDLKVPPGIGHGQTLRVPKYGNCGVGGGPAGDLVCDIRLVGPVPDVERVPAGRDERPAQSVGATEGVQALCISVVEALLGARVPIDTPQGRVVLNLPACTNGGARFRLRGKGLADASGTPTDLVLQLKIVTPPHLDEESRELVERFAERNDYDPRS